MLTLCNLFADPPGEPGSEHFLTLFESAGVKIEQIVSRSAATPPGVWHDQEQDEWVLVLRGEAVLQFSGGTMVTMNPGDCLLIPSHTRHRVERTSEKTVWLAVHLTSRTGPISA